MTTARKVRETALCAAMLAASALALRGSVRHPSRLNAVDRAILQVSSPLQGMLAGAARGVQNGMRRYIALVGVAKDNDELRRDNALLKAELLAARTQASRERELEELLQLESRVAAESVAARVIGADTNAYFRVARLRIERGEGEVRPGQAVLAQQGVVGRVHRVYGRFSDVLLAIDPKSSIDVVVTRTGAKGILRGAGARDRYRATIELDASATVKAGDLVVTSGLGGAFPRDVPLGRVLRVSPRDLSLFQIAEVEPTVDFAKLDHVVVLVSASPAEDPQPAQSERSGQPARALQPYR